MHDLGTLSGGESSNYAVSANELVVTESDTNLSSLRWRAFRWTSKSGMQDVGELVKTARDDLPELISALEGALRSSPDDLPTI